MIGTTLAHYRITAALGAGGMGEVWRATDEKLGREVALKVLPEDFAKDPDRLARFEREAKVLASLNHPNIAHLYGLENVNTQMAAGTAAPQGPVVGHASRVPGGGDDPQRGTPPGEAFAQDDNREREGGNSKFKTQNSKLPAEAGTVTFLVMELVEGDDLSERIARSAIPVDEVIPIALQIAEALEAAHEQGIVHRDLKPSNIKITDDGTVKVLDFGLAKAWDMEGGDLSSSFSPTLTQNATLEGVILGTAAYMSPEQTRGKKVDRRADIWAFGVVLWEMLTGSKLFEGETVSDVMAAILTKEPDINSLPAATPHRIRALIGRCLHRDPKMRQRDMGDVRLDLSETLDDQDEPAVGDRGRGAGSRWRVGLLGAAVGLALGVGLFAVLARQAPVVISSDRSPRRSILIPAPIGGSRHMFGIAISPDGSMVALRQEYDGAGPLELRRPDSFESTLILDTECLVVAMDAHDSSGFSVDLSADGDRILVNRPAMSWTDQRPVVLVSDWFVESEELAGNGGAR